MGRKKQNKNKIIITKDNLLYQPLSLALSGYEASALQHNIVIAILKKMKTFLKELRDNQFKNEPRQLSIFTTTGIQENILRDGDLMFDIHMNEIVDEAKHYPVAFNTLYSISDATVYVPIMKDGEECMLRMKLFDTIDKNVEVVTDKDGNIVRYKYKNRSPVSTLLIRKEVAEFLFPSDGRIYDFLEETAKSIAEKFPKRIYTYLSSYKYLSSYTIDYWKFRAHIGTNDKDAPIDGTTGEKKIIYPYYCDFVKRILDPSVKKLREMSDEDLSDFYFEVEPIYKGSRRAKNPDQLKFNFILSDLGKSIQCEKGQISKEIEREMFLKKELNQTKMQILMLMKRVTDENSVAFWKKVSQLVADMKKKRKTPIEDVRGWANVSLTRFMDEWQQDKDDKKQHDLFSGVGEEPKKETKVVAEKKVPILSDEEKEKWDSFMSFVRGKVDERSFQTWFVPMMFVSFKDSILIISVPSQFFYEYIEEKYVDVMKQTLYASFGEGCKLMYNIAKP